MSVDKSLTPSTSLMMPVGYWPGCDALEDLKIAEAARTMSMYQLPHFSLPRIKKQRNYSEWGLVEKLAFVRESLYKKFRVLDGHCGWRLTTYKDDDCPCMSDVREHMRNFHVAGKVIISLDSDNSEGISWRGTPIWNRTVISDPLAISKAVLADVRKFDNKARQRGVKFAGVSTGTHPWHPGDTSGYGTPIHFFISGPRHFEESFTIETDDRAGHYPKGRNRHEALYRALSIKAEHGDEALGFLDAVHHFFKKREIYPTYDIGSAASLALLVQEFGYDAVMRRSYAGGKGFNQQAAGKGRNRDKRKKSLTAAA